MDRQAIAKMLQTRYTAKKYSNKKISKEDLQLIKDTFQMSPSSINIQSWKLIIVSSQEMKDKLAPSTWDVNQEKVQQCSHFLVFAARKVTDEYLESVGDDLVKAKNLNRDEHFSTVIPFLKNFLGTRELESWSEKQVYLNFGFMLAVLGMLGIDSTSMEGMTPKDFDKILNLEGTEFHTAVALCIGYADESDLNKPGKTAKFRLNQEKIITEI